MLQRTFSSVYVMLRLGTVCMFSSAACLHSSAGVRREQP
jgi:hypothetical protein